MARKPPWDGSRISRDGGRFYQGCLPSPPGGWIWLNVLGVVAQRKLFSIVTGKRCMSKVSPGLGWYEQATSGICFLTVNDSMVVRSHHCSLGSNPWRSQIYSVQSQQNWHVETMGGGARGYVMVTSAGFCRTGRLREWEQWNWCVLVDC